jgi:outer membrane protein assembly factor BamB
LKAILRVSGIFLIVLLCFSWFVVIAETLKRLPMKKILFFVLPLGMLISNEIDRPTKIETPDLKLIWKSEIGFTTHRTEPIIQQGKLFIGSNGSHFQDYALDNGNGAIALDASSGNALFSMATGGFGDLDVNGILFEDNKLYFGNDNDEVLCYTLKGDLVWRTSASGDIEHAPTLIKSGNSKRIVFATEIGELRALDPTNGKTIWSFYHSKFDGWKAGDNRAIFKVKMHFSSGVIFFSEPALADLNNDGVTDLIYNAGWGEILAINGENGKKMWEIASDYYDEGYCSLGKQCPIVVGEGNEVRIASTYSKRDNNKKVIILFDRFGKQVKQFETNNESYNLLNHHNGIIYTASGLIKIKDDHVEELITDGLSYQKNAKTQQRFWDGQVAKQRINYQNEACAVVVFQRDQLHPNQSVLMIVGTQTGRNYMMSLLPAVSEMTPLVADANKDGKLDVLIGCYDQFLYCFDLQIPASNRID